MLGGELCVKQSTTRCRISLQIFHSLGSGPISTPSGPQIKRKLVFGHFSAIFIHFGSDMAQNPLSFDLGPVRRERKMRNKIPHIVRLWLTHNSLRSSSYKLIRILPPPGPQLSQVASASPHTVLGGELGYKRSVGGLPTEKNRRKIKCSPRHAGQ